MGSIPQDLAYLFRVSFLVGDQRAYSPVPQENIKIPYHSCFSLLVWVWIELKKNIEIA